MTLAVYDSILKYLKDGKKGFIATIVRRIGAAPRREGSLMFVSEDGKIFGTIGGGTLEKEVKEQGRDVIGEKMPKILTYRMDAKSPEEEGMLCGGNVDVLIEPIFPEHIKIYEHAQICLKERKEGMFLVRFKDSYKKSFVTKDGSVIGDSLDEKDKSEVIEKLGTKRPFFLDDSRVIIPLNLRSVLYIFGAGHVSRYLTQLANLVDFEVTVIDESEEFAKKEDFPDAKALYVQPFEESFRMLDFTGEEYVVIVTRGHKTDTLCLKEVLKRPFRYVGMIGSKRKVNAVFQYLMEKGYSEELLKKVHAPIGIDINSETPQEVAVSIVAELIKVRGEYLKNVA